ncbi:hypothetical protein [Paracoccus salsus]|uniref:hypothetical protein n=1 Tax=Paracoccus salsus TaxID=2911061 RepID=UPI001F29CDFA|nr:hypothetical protein [Paracoccus salsus]MCF3974990.1 hypothetical protein [Paracoccus salsus]
MRPGIIIAIVIAVAIIIGGLFWVNTRSDEVGLEEQGTEPLAPAVGEEGRASDSPLTGDAEIAGGDEAGMGDDAPPVVGDEITEGAIVVDSATDGPVILDPEDTATSTRDINDADPTNSAAMPGATADATAEAGADTAATETDGADSAEAEQLLTPAAFDRDEILALIDNSEKLTNEQRSTLRALVEGASANPAMVEPGIATIRRALDLPPLN